MVIFLIPGHDSKICENAKPHFCYNNDGGKNYGEEYNNYKGCD